MNTFLRRIVRITLSTLPALLMAGTHAEAAVDASTDSPAPVVELDNWGGFSVDETGWAYTNNAFFDWVWVGEDPWIYSLSLDSWLYLPGSHITASGAWGYFINLDEISFDFAKVEFGWLFSHSLRTWFYIPDSTLGSTAGWSFVRNAGESQELSEIVITPEYTADFDEPEIADRYAGSYRLTPAEIEEVTDYDENITVSTSSNGITFTSTASSFQGNRFVRIGFQNGRGGLFDLTALDGISGKIGIDVHADVDLSDTTNGFYVRVKSGSEDVAAFDRLGAGAVEEDLLLETYLTNSADEAYVEITLPWQGSVTIKDIYLYMETKVTGFADMAERITGGEGATAENTHTVENAAEFDTALTAARESGAPSIINVAGTVTYDDWANATGNSQRQIPIGSDFENLSIIGVGADGIFDGIGLELHGRNIVLQNLTIRMVLGRDAIAVNNAEYVLIDHNTLYNEPISENSDKDKFDELISIKNDAQNVIMSWNLLYDSHKTILVGSNDHVEALPDRKLIMHHNWVRDSGSRVPLYRGGHAHIYNNYFQNIDSAINARTGSKLLIENNYFANVRRAIGYWFDTENPSGLWELNGNYFDENVEHDIPTSSTIEMEFESGYDYTLDPVQEVPDIVMSGAGAGQM